MKNQEDIGQVFEPYYKKDDIVILIKLLKDHISIAADIIHSTINNDMEYVLRCKLEWYINAVEITDHLIKMNPEYNRNILRNMIFQHLDLTEKEFISRFHGDFDSDIRNFDEVFNQILEMADAISDGIIKQQVEKFKE